MHYAARVATRGSVASAVAGPSGHSVDQKGWQVAFSRVFARCGGRAATPAGQSSASRRSPRFGSADSWLFAVGGDVC